MILAAALAAEGNPPPPVLDRLRKWRYFNTPWRAGGLSDQNAGEVDRMLAAENTHDAWYVYKNRPKGWHKSLEGKWGLLRYIAWLILIKKPPGYEKLPQGIEKLATEYLKQLMKNANKTE